MGTMTVDYLEGDRFAVGIRDHVVHVDQPVGDGGADTGPTPTELFVAGLASCVAFYARRYLARHGLSAAGLQVTAEYTMAARPARVVGIRISLHPPDGVPVARRKAMLAVASHCTVHNTLLDPPEMTVELASLLARP